MVRCSIRTTTRKYKFILYVDKLAKYLRTRGVYTTFRYYPLHWVEYYRPLEVGHEHLPGTEYAANHTLCIPLHQGLSSDDIHNVIKSISYFTSPTSPPL